ncbi:MAG: IclR family transcriptional regulator [Actinomycetota bacterium]
MRATDSAERVVHVLDLLGAAPEGLGVSEVARELSVHRSTASRLLGTLAASRIVERDERSARYRLGARIVGLAASAVSRLPVVSQARPELEHLSLTSSETANLSILDGTHVVYVDQVTPAQTVVMASWVGRRSPAHASSSGKVMLAFGDPALRDLVLRGTLEAVTSKTVTDPAKLRAILEQTRRRGYAVSTGELEDGLVTLAAPVVVDGRAVAAVSLSGPSFRIPARDVSRLARLLVDAAAGVGHRIAGRSSGAAGSA